MTHPVTYESRLLHLAKNPKNNLERAAHLCTALKFNLLARHAFDLFDTLDLATQNNVTCSNAFNEEIVPTLVQHLTYRDTKQIVQQIDALSSRRGLSGHLSVAINRSLQQQIDAPWTSLNTHRAKTEDMLQALCQRPHSLPSLHLNQLTTIAEKAVQQTGYTQHMFGILKDVAQLHPPFASALIAGVLKGQHTLTQNYTGLDRSAVLERTQQLVSDLREPKFNVQQKQPQQQALSHRQQQALA